MVPITPWENDLKVDSQQSSKEKRSKEIMQGAIAVDFPLKVISRRITLLHERRSLRAREDKLHFPSLLGALCRAGLCGLCLGGACILFLGGIFFFLCLNG